MSQRRIAVLGAGLAGTSTALELARRGCHVDLYDAHPHPIARASVHNEGKIHLGLVYAHDTTLQTARTMILGAVHFTACLSRWIDLHPDDLPISTPYTYAVHTGTLVDPDALARHYGECQRLVADACAATGHAYLGRARALHVERLSRRTMSQRVNGDYCVDAFQTSELAVDPRIVAQRLREAVHASPRVRFIGGADVRGLARCSASTLQVRFRLNGTDDVDRYDHVVNALWQGRLRIDEDAGLTPERQWLFRYKLGGWLRCEADDVPSLTFVLGPYGDIVNFGDAGVYVSWYPEGLLGTSGDVAPPDWDRLISDAQRRDVLQRSYDALAKRCPLLRTVAFERNAVQAAGGVIFAWGANDIDDPASHLHTRHQIGVHSDGTYHSINTGKYTMAPYLGCQAADRVMGIS